MRLSQWIANILAVIFMPILFPLFFVWNKRLLWMLALPYIVDCSRAGCLVNHKGETVIIAVTDKEYAEDFAFALNEAHEHRTRENNKASSRYLGDGLWENTNKETGASAIGDKPFDFKSACGQDNCGVEP